MKKIREETFLSPSRFALGKKKKKKIIAIAKLFAFKRNYNSCQYYIVKVNSQDNRTRCQTCLKQLRNCILCIISAWSFFCSARVNISLHFLPILLVKLGFRLSVFWFFMFLFHWFLVFIFLFSKDLITFFNSVLTLFKPSVKI